MSEFNLPGSSFGELQKIIKGYSHAQENASLDTLSKLIGLHTTIISRNNKFLSDVGLVSGGMKKNATELGKKLGRALDHKQSNDAQKYWKEAVQTNEKVAGLITTVRIKGGMTEDEFASHTLYVSGQNNTAGNKTGARCLLDVLSAAGLLQEEGGKVTVTNPIQDESPPFVGIGEERITQPARAPNQATDGSEPTQIPTRVQMHSPSTTPQVVINIQLQIPECENAEVYENLFRALRKNLLSPAE